MSTIIGQDFELVDEAISPDVAALVGRPLLLSTAGPASPVTTSRANTGTPTVDAQLEVMLAGGASEIVVQGYGASLPTLAQATALLPAGPGSMVAPEAILTADHQVIAAAAKTQGKVALLNGASGASLSVLSTLASADIAGTDCRYAGLFGDFIIHQLTVGTVTVPMTLGVAAAIARNDRENNGNTGLAAVGKRGIIVGAQSIVGGAKTQADRDTLATAQVNTVRTYNGQVRVADFRTLANLTTLPQWWDLSGSRVMTDYRAQVAVLNEDAYGEQIDGVGAFLGELKAGRNGVLSAMWKKGALFGLTADQAFGVDVGPTVNPTSQLALGRVAVQTRFRVSPHVEHVLDQVVRRPITAAL